MFYKIPSIENTPAPPGLSSPWKISLSWMLTLPFILQVVTVVGWVGYIAHRNAQQSVESLTQQLLLVVSQRVEQKLTTYLEAPILANQNHSDAVRRGSLNLDLSRFNTQREQYLWQQMNLFPNFSWISIGSEKGDCVGIWRPSENAPLQFSIVNATTDHFGTYYATRTPGIRTQQLKVERPEFDPRTRPWYKKAIGSKQSVWTPIYQGFTPGTIFIAASQALYDAEDRFVGVSGIDLSLTEIQHFLTKTKVSPSGQIFLIERSGMLVSSSTQEQPFREVNGQPVQIHAIDSETPLIRGTMQSLLHQVNDLHQIQNLENFHFREQAKYVQVVPFTRQKGLDWLIVIVIPESDVMGQIYAGNQKTIVLCLGALISVIALNSLIMRHLTQPIEGLQSANHKLHRLAYLDGLTQIPNRRSFDERFMQEWHRMKREQLPLAIVFCDVDYFKKYNDTYGHQLGDDCLCTVASAIAAVVRRPADLVARYGGEEFVMLLPNTDLEGGIEVATAMRAQIHRLQIPHRASDVSSNVTMSFGVASLIPQDPKHPEELLAMADRSLYTAKREGRDRIHSESTGPQE
jgi:diguanylate cyclase (GGDEF)-like protein